MTDDTFFVRIPIVIVRKDRLHKEVERWASVAEIEVESANNYEEAYESVRQALDRLVNR
jgi:hypothetical protein